MPRSGDIYEPYERLVKIVILGREAEVPENNRLLRCFQYIAPDTVALGRFCWNNECGNSKFYYRLPGDPSEKKSRACRFVVVEGMRITVLSAELKWVLREFLKNTAPVEVDEPEEEDFPPPPLFS